MKPSVMIIDDEENLRKLLGRVSRRAYEGNIFSFQPPVD
jgi:hypothetical protein